MKNQKPDYRSFMLRIWIEQTNGEKWRFSLEDTRTGKRKGFASINKLKAYLNEITKEVADFSKDTNEPKNHSWS
jgi:hypothetical protein